MQMVKLMYHGTGKQMVLVHQTDGTINSTSYSVNTTAGFSIVKYTGNGVSGATIAHGLGATPKLYYN